MESDSLTKLSNRSFQAVNHQPHRLDNVSMCSSGPLSINSDSNDISELNFDQPNRAEDHLDQIKACCSDCLFCCGSRCRRMGCKTMFRDRFPKGFAILVVLLINTLENIAVYGAFTGLQDRIIGQSEFNHYGYVFVIFQWCGGRILYPITGLVADTCLGRYRTIKYGFSLMWIAFAVIAINELLIYSRGGFLGHETFFERYYFLPCIAVMLLIVSSACIEANIIPFGADQVQQGASTSEISSYFYYFYFSRVIGMFFGIAIFLLVFDTNVSLLPDSNDSDVEQDFTFVTLTTLHPIVAVLALSLALISHLCTEQSYFMDRGYENPLRLIVNVLFYAATVKRGIPVYRRAFRYGEDRKKRIELAKVDYDGIFTNEEVEDVKTFFRICLVILSLSGTFLTFQMITRALNDQVYQTSQKVLKSGEFSFLPNELFTLLLSSFMLLSIIIMNHFVSPLFPGIRMTFKIGLGALFTAMSPAVAMVFQFALVDVDSHPLIHLIWLLFPVIFLSIGHMHINTAGLEFIYAQSPNSMKGLLTGVFFFWYGVFNAVGIIFFNSFPSEENSDWIPTVGVYYAITTFVGALSVVMYAAVACIYRNRVRPSDRSEVEDDAVRRGMYGHVSTLNFPQRNNSVTF